MTVPDGSRAKKITEPAQRAAMSATPTPNRAAEVAGQLPVASEVFTPSGVSYAVMATVAVVPVDCIPGKWFTRAMENGL